MYSFANRKDCEVVDEPFYAAYLAKTGIVHPMRDKILTSQSQNSAKVVDRLVGPVDRPVFYQKHMTQHMIEGVPREWMANVINVFLIRHPVRVVASYAKKREGPCLEDLGFEQQVQLFDYAKQLGQSPIVIDSFDIRKSPEKMMRKLCAATDISWDSGMLSWNKGGHASDGVWAKHWYGAVHASTGFAALETELPKLDTQYARVAAQAMPFYDELAQLKI
jgi:hypothetical protein